MGSLFGKPQAAPNQTRTAAPNQTRTAPPRQQATRSGNVDIKGLKTKMIRDSALASGYATSNKPKARSVLQEMEKDLNTFRNDPAGRQDNAFIREQEETIRDIKSLL